MPQTNGDGKAILLFASPKGNGMLPPKLKSKNAMPGMPEMSDSEDDNCGCECCAEGCEKCSMEGKCCSECEYGKEEDSGMEDEAKPVHGGEKMSAMREMVIKITQGE